MEILFPRFTGFYAENLSSADAIFYGNFSVWHIFIQQFANFSNLFLCKFRRWIEFTLAALICAALSDHVRYIIALSSKKKMIGIAARRIVAFMQNAYSMKTIMFRDWSEMYFPTNTGSSMELMISQKDTISHRTADSTCPQPAFVSRGNFNFRPEGARKGAKIPFSVIGLEVFFTDSALTVFKCMFHKNSLPNIISIVNGNLQGGGAWR